MAGPGSMPRRSGPLAVLLVCALAGLLFAAAASTSGGSDLRPAGGDVASLVDERTRRVETRQESARALQDEIDVLSAGAGGAVGEVLDRVASLQDLTGLGPTRGPGLRVTLTDAPRDIDPAGLDPNVLVVHQQDIQAFVNALWAGGAEAVSLQGQRLISTSGIKCVGSTVVLDGVPYAPPYVVEAVGDVGGMNFSLSTSPEAINYGRYAERYRLGLEIEPDDDIALAPYAGIVRLQHAEALR